MIFENPELHTSRIYEIYTTTSRRCIYSYVLWLHDNISSQIDCRENSNAAVK